MHVSPASIQERFIIYVRCLFAQGKSIKLKLLSWLIEVLLHFKDPAFMLIGVSNFFGMAALYIPFFYLVEAAEQNVNYKKHRKGYKY